MFEWVAVGLGDKNDDDPHKNREAFRCAQTGTECHKLAADRLWHAKTYCYDTFSQKNWMNRIFS